MRTRMVSAAVAAAVVALGLAAGAWALEGGLGDDAAEAARTAWRVTAAAEDQPAPVDGASMEQVALGRRLFFDARLSGSGTMSCASCHGPDRGWGPPHDHSLDAGGLRAPSLVDVRDVPALGWDGRFGSIEEVTFAPITSPIRMNMPEVAAVRRIATDATYATMFAAAFGTAPSKEGVERALAAFERTIAHGRSRFDRWTEGEDDAIDASAKRGFVLFEGKARCSTCHSGEGFTDQGFHDVGVGDGKGRAAASPRHGGLHAFKTPTLRDVGERGPYMHDGSLPDLAAVVEHYDRGGVDRPSRDPAVRPLGLTAREKADLVAFLETLTSPPGGR